jgi:putative transcriptional regulator
MLLRMEHSLQGRLLIAVPTLGDPNFAGSVVLIAEHDAQGAMGLVLNHPLDVTVADAVPILSGFVAHDEPVHRGGPVQPEAVLALGDFVDGNRSAAIAFGSVGFLPADADETLDPATVIRARVFAGYAGWGAGQLESELEESSSPPTAMTASRSVPRSCGGRRCAATAARSRCSRCSRTIRR